jgi:soluble lytic murein transglycosylase-like protein
MWATRPVVLLLLFLTAPGCRLASLGPLLDARCLEASAGSFEVVTLSPVDHAILEAADTHGVSAELIRAIIQAESEFDPLAISSRGACGLMQLMPVTARRFGVLDCFDPRQNIVAGTRFLKTLLTRYDGSVPLSIAAYNAGEGAVARHGGIPPYRQTRAYVRRVQALVNDAPNARSKTS